MSNFQTDRVKNKRGIDIFRKGRNFKKKKPKNENLEEGIVAWTSFYRANPHRFASDYLGVDLKIFQQILLYAMMHNLYFVYIAARGQGKSFLTALFAIIKGILFPNTKIVVAAGQKTQAREIIGKIEEFRRSSPNLQREIKFITDTGNDPRVEFHNGSTIRTVAANDGARGARSNVLIIDEFRMVSEDIIETVLRKFQTAPRKLGFLSKPEYHGRESEFQERNQELYLSSAWYKADASWNRVVDYNNKFLEGKPYFACQLPYQLSIKEGLYIREQAQEEMDSAAFNEIRWEMEMNAMFWGSNLNSYFTFEELDKNRTLKKLYYPRNIAAMVGDSSLKIPPKKKGELRVVSADIATMGGSDNDASIYSVARLIPIGNNEYERQTVYMEDLVGGHTQVQATRIRELFEDFDCDYIVLDTRSAGIGVYDAMTTELVNTTTGEVYEPVSCINNKELADRCAFVGAKKVVYSITGSAQLNSLIAVAMKDALRKGKIKFGVDEQNADDILSTIKGYSTNKISPEAKAYLKMPYVQFTSMVHEFLNLEQEYTSDGSIRLKEPRSGRKDRYSSISYLNYFANELEIKNRRIKPKEVSNVGSFFMARPAKLF